MSLQSLIESVLSKLGVEGVTPGPEGEYEVVFDSSLDLQILPLEGSLILIRSRLGTVPGEFPADRDYLASVLSRNLANLRRQSELITLDREKREVWLYRLVRATADRTDDAALLAVLEEFVDSLEWWRATTDERSATVSSPFQFLRP
ncbi:MAG TPA: CesT family type III secretion system chaperone [Caulifigura sp.]|nr:CesT family type III secretion system chaperone [Caulifigura sp.]